VQEQAFRTFGAGRFFFVREAVLVVRVGRDRKARDTRLDLLEVCTTFVMRWPVKSWNEQASKIASICSSTKTL